jgi:hypothetical protein
VKHNLFLIPFMTCYICTACFLLSQLQNRRRCAIHPSKIWQWKFLWKKSSDNDVTKWKSTDLHHIVHYGEFWNFEVCLYLFHHKLFLLFTCKQMKKPVLLYNAPYFRQLKSETPWLNMTWVLVCLTSCFTPPTLMTTFGFSCRCRMIFAETRKFDTTTTFFRIFTCFPLLKYLD